jgi:hypothetical protein
MFAPPDVYLATNIAEPAIGARGGPVAEIDRGLKTSRHDDVVRSIHTNPVAVIIPGASIAL